MASITDISAHLRVRREEAGLSLSDVARRAGTSPATVSRYETGWYRFEVYTLHKLATALGCELDLRLLPVKHERKRLSRRALVSQLQRLFWDHRLRPEDLTKFRLWVVERVLEYGNLEDVHALIDCIGRVTFLKDVARARFSSPRAGRLWDQILEKEGIPCTRKSLPTQAGISWIA